MTENKSPLRILSEAINTQYKFQPQAEPDDEHAIAQSLAKMDQAIKYYVHDTVDKAIQTEIGNLVGQLEAIICDQLNLDAQQNESLRSALQAFSANYQSPHNIWDLKARN